VRLSDADRELIYESLSRSAAEGRISMEELERRVEIVHAAQTREDVASLLEDLPPVASAAPGTAKPWWRVRPHGEADAPAVGWTATGERFRDPRSKRIMRVWVDAAGGRHYVPDEA
jgi:hypothetical protein